MLKGFAGLYLQICNLMYVLQVEDAVTSLVSNFSKAIYDMEEAEEAKNEAAFQIVSGLSTIFVDRIKGPDALYNVVVSIGNY